MTVTLPRLTFTWHKTGHAEIAIAPGIFPQGSGLVLGVSGYRPMPVLRSDARRAVAVIGAPVFDDMVAPTRTAEAALQATDLQAFARGLNGQFIILVLDKAEGRLTILNDRFNGIPLYWADLGDRVVAANLYSDLFRHLRDRPDFGLRREVMLQFVWLNRVMGDATHDTLSRYLTSATALEIDADGARPRRYWRPDFTKRHDRSTQAAGAEFTSRLQASLRRLTRDETPKRYGHFLSGGHDSRAVLAAFPEPPTCFTVAFSDNLEVRYAREAAEAIGAEHHYLSLRQDHFVENFEAATELCGGLYTFEGALFLGLESQVQAHADVVFHGHAIDYLFQGMYLPAHWLTLFGRPTFFRRLEPLGGELAERYLNQIPFRVKGADLPALMRDDMRAEALASLHAAVTAILREGDDCCQTDDDRWEYLIIHALGRHYSHPNIVSKLSCAEQRTPCFDADLFDFYLSLPREQRVNADVVRHALNTVHPRLGAIPTGNWGIAAGASSAYKTFWLIARKLLRHITGNARFKAPTPEDRTWPNRDHYLRQHPRMREEIEAAMQSPALEDALPFFDWPRLRQQTTQWLAQPSGGSQFLMALVTLNRLLTQAR